MAADDLSGRVLGGCVLLEKLGEGGMGAVYRALQTSLNRFVAVKVLRPELRQARPDFAERFRREAEFLAGLDHPHILPVYEHGDDGQLSFIIMPLMQGGSLAERLRQGGPLTVARTVQVFTPLAQALDYAHRQDILHRDLKPHNVFLNQEDHVRLGDFGIAVALESRHSLTGSGAVIGTPAYMSPEQARGDRLDARSDLYSLGVMAYEALTGALPFDAPTPLAVGVKHITDPPRPPREVRPELPEAVETALLRALAKRPQDRPESAAELVQALGAAETPPRPAPGYWDNPTRPPPEGEPPPRKPPAGVAMVCGFCGGPLALDEAACPACGQSRPLPRPQRR